MNAPSAFGVLERWKHDGRTERSWYAGETLYGQRWSGRRRDAMVLTTDEAWRLIGKFRRSHPEREYHIRELTVVQP